MQKSSWSIDKSELKLYKKIGQHPGLALHFQIVNTKKDLLSTRIYDLVFINVCHFHHHLLLHLTVSQITVTIEILVLISWILHPRILLTDPCSKEVAK